MNLIKSLCWLYLLVLVSSCESREKLVVYVDPWYMETTDRLLEAFSAEHPGIDVELRVLSTEVIAQHLHFGQPIDVVLGLGQHIVHRKGIHLKRVHELASTHLLVVDGGEHPLQQKLGGRSAVAVPATDRPLSDWVRDWRPAILVEHEQFTANFQPQMVAYLERGWLRYGIVPAQFLTQSKKKYRILEESEAIPGAFFAAIPTVSKHPENAALFMDFLASEKTKTLLAMDGFNH